MPLDDRERPVLIVSDDPTFSRLIVERWQEDACVPVFRVLGSDACLSCDAGHFDLVVVGGLHPDACASVLATFSSCEIPVIVIGAEGGLREVAKQCAPGVLVLPARQSWPDVLVVLGAEILRREQAQARARRAEMANAVLLREAKLGQYMIDVRHNLNNALTSVLGNAELLLLGESRFNCAERSQIDTIRVMALRMHETLKRFSSLEKELRVAEGANVKDDWPSMKEERQSRGDSGRRQLAQAAGAD